MKIGRYSALFFNPSKDKTLIECRSLQTFAYSDCIVIQVLYDSTTEGTPTIREHNLTRNTSQTLVNSAILIDNSLQADGTMIETYLIKNQSADYVYSISVEYDDFYAESEPYRVLNDSDEELKDTILIQYSNDNNKRTKEGIFIMPSDEPTFRIYFSFRADGGFKDTGWSFGVDSEQFTTQGQSLLGVYEEPYKVKQITLGKSGDGVPVWFAELLNTALSCNYFYVDGVRYSRNEGETPEIQQTIESYNAFIVTQNVRKVDIEKAELNLMWGWLNTERTLTYYTAKRRPQIGEYVYNKMVSPVGTIRTAYNERNRQIGVTLTGQEGWLIDNEQYISIEKL